MAKSIMDYPREERKARTHQRMVYNDICNLRRSIKAAKDNQVDIGDIATLDLDYFMFQVKKVGDIIWGTEKEKLGTTIDRDDIEPLDSEIAGELDAAAVDF